MLARSVVSLIHIAGRSPHRDRAHRGLSVPLAALLLLIGTGTAFAQSPPRLVYSVVKTVTPGVQVTDTIFAYNDNAATQFYVDAPVCTGVLSTCSATPTPGKLTNVAAGAFIRVIRSYTAGSVGTGNFSINVTDANSSLVSTASTNVTAPGTLTVSPKTNNRSTINASGPGSYTFTVTNTRGVPATISITGACRLAVTCSFTPINRAFAANEAYQVPINFTGNSFGGIGYAAITATTTGASDFAEDTVTVNPPPAVYGVSVTLPGGSDLVWPAGSTQHSTFVVTDTGNVPATFNVSWNCQPQVTCTAGNGQTNQLNPQTSQAFDVYYTAGPAGSNGTVQFTATGVGAASSATATTPLRVSVPAAPTQPQVSPDNQNITAQTSLPNAQQQFNVWNTSSTTAAVFNLSWSCSGSGVTCSGTTTLSVPPNGSLPFIVSYATGSTTGPAGTVTLTATSGTLTDNGSVNVTLVNPPLAVSPKNQSLQLTANWKSNQVFTVTNRGAGGDSYTVVPSCQNATVCTASPSSFGLGAGTSQDVKVLVGIGTPGSIGTISLAVAAGGGAKDTGRVNFTAVASTSVPVAVTPKNAAVSVIYAQSNTYAFQVKNGTLSTDTYTLTPSCSGVTCNSVSPTTLTIKPDSTKSATVTFTAGALGSTGTVKLIASTVGGGADTGSVNTTAGLAPTMSIFPSNLGNLWYSSWSHNDQVYQITWTGPTASFTVARSCSGAYVTCTAGTTTKTFQTNVTDTVQITMDTHGPPPNGPGGTLLLKLTGAGRVDSSLSTVNVYAPQPAAVAVNPSLVYPPPGTTQTATFTVTNPGQGQSKYAFTASCPGSAICTLSKSSAWIPGGYNASTSVDVTYVAGAANTTSTVQLSAALTGTTTATGTQTVKPSATTPMTATVDVSPLNGALTINPNQSISTVFTITNNGPSAASFRYLVVCPTNVTACSATSAAGNGLTGQTPSLPANGGTFNVTVSYTGGTVATQPLTLRADDLTNSVTTANNWALGSMNVAVANTGPITVASRALGLNGSVARDACLDTPLGKGASYECGDLRFSYSLPTMTAMNKPRQVTLFYLSSQANASAVIEADVSMNTSQAPTQIIPKLTIVGKSPITFPAMTWNAAWPANMPRRITVPVDGIAQALNTGVYQYILEVSETTNGTTSAKADTGYVTIVNRSTSEIGRGWWVEGIEQLVTVNSTQKLWVGGDGSTRVYTQTANANIYTVASPLNRPDTLEWTGSSFKRHLPNGAATFFSATGLHYQTTNALGQITYIHHDGNGRIYGVQLPVPGNGATGPMWQFSYQTSNDNTGVSRLESIHLSGTGITDRPTYFTDLPTGWISQIQFLGTSDPEWATSGSYSRFAYNPDLTTSPSAATRDLVGVTNPAGYVTRFGYVAGKLRADTVQMNGAGDIVSTFCPAETRSRNSACSTQPEALANAVTLFDGPRGTVGDTTKFYINRYGAPDTVVNAQGQAVRLTRNTTFPLLPASVTQPNGFKTLVYYNGRGLVDSSVAVHPYGDTLNAVTSYKWHATVPAPVKVTMPMGDTTAADYRSDGQPLWRFAGGVKVTFNYNSACTNQLSSTVYPDASRDSLVYDTSACNLASSITPLHPATTYLRDAYGRVIRTKSPIDSLGTQLRTDTVAYSKRDQVLTSKSYYGTDSLVARNVYDLDGNLVTAVQKAYPRLARYWYPYTTHPTVDSLVHGYSYDAAGRNNSEWSGPYSWNISYDSAGNVLRGKDLGTVLRTYDELNRLTWQKGSDTNNLRYDPRMGWLIAADNQNAQVRRSYYPNGAIKTDTLRIQKEGVSAPNFSAHQYVMSYTYDLNGRRKTVTNPFGNTTTYNYDFRTGDLSTVTDVAGLTHRFHYDLMGRLDTLVRMTGRTDSVIEANTFDLASRLRKRLIVQNSRGLTIYGDTLFYDGRDKVIKHNGDVLGYAPLGQLVLSQMAAFSTTPEEFGTDALGLHKWRTTQYKPSNTMASTTMTDTIYYAPGTSVINATVTWKDSGSPDTTLYSIDSYFGNQIGSQKLSRTDIDPTTPEWVGGIHQRYGYRQNTLSQYNRENRLSYFRLQKDTIWQGGTESRWYTATETYMYDALGRRVWVRSLKDTTCTFSDPGSGCHSTDTRTVWDGDEIIAEERTQPLDAGRVSYNFGGYQYGTVEYSHVGIIDQPITVIGAGTLLPYADWRGAIDEGTCASATTCPSYIFPGGISSSYLSNLFKRQGSPNWYGSLTEQQQDASGLQYKRNRYYDPVAGTFTQEDPIGLAGGYNTYGYAGGDPVNYSDPLGLCIEPITGAACIYVGAAVAGAAAAAGATYLATHPEQAAALRDAVASVSDRLTGIAKQAGRIIKTGALVGGLLAGGEARDFVKKWSDIQKARAEQVEKKRKADEERARKAKDEKKGRGGAGGGGDGNGNGGGPSPGSVDT
jgi:RHS repeat-associated protein